MEDGGSGEGSVVVKNLPANEGDARDLGSILGLGRSPGRRNGNPLQYSCLESPPGQRSLAGYSPRGHKSQRWLSRWAQIEQKGEISRVPLGQNCQRVTLHTCKCKYTYVDLNSLPLKQSFWVNMAEFPSGPVVRIPCFHGWRPGFDP